MKFFRYYGDERQQLSRCVYCGKDGVETRDHVPSKVLLDSPYPEHLPVVPSCKKCNQNLSLDEEYVACFIECARVGSVFEGSVMREKIRKILFQKPALKTRLQKSFTAVGNKEFILGEKNRIENIFIKLGKGHLAFEFNSPQYDDPESIELFLLDDISSEECGSFNAVPQMAIFPEIGSRASQRMVISESNIGLGWQIVQEDRYRYLVASLDFLLVRIVVSEYIGCRIIWRD